jgi:hypothetical protein
LFGGFGRVGFLRIYREQPRCIWGFSAKDPLNSAFLGGRCYSVCGSRIHTLSHSSNPTHRLYQLPARIRYWLGRDRRNFPTALTDPICTAEVMARGTFANVRLVNKVRPAPPCTAEDKVVNRTAKVTRAGRDRKPPLNERQRPHVRSVRVALRKGYNRVGGIGRASRNVA